MEDNVQQILYEKALDQVAHLQSSYEAKRISAETFKVGVETIWNVLGGVILGDDFAELMHEANKEIATLPSEPRIRVLTDGTRQLVLMRAGQHVSYIAANGLTSRTRTFDVDDEAIQFAATLEENAIKQGYGETQ